VDAWATQSVTQTLNQHSGGNKLPWAFVPWLSLLPKEICRRGGGAGGGGEKQPWLTGLQACTSFPDRLHGPCSSLFLAVLFVLTCGVVPSLPRWLLPAAWKVLAGGSLCRAAWCQVG
jgi:hypothetical protein